VLSDGVDAPGSNTIFAKINSAGIGVTATLTNDPDGRPNRITLSSGSAIQLGSGADTSNFLAAAKLLASPGTTTRVSTGNLGSAKTDAVLNSARLAGALGGSSGSFTINGVSIAWDAGVDTVNDVIAKVNSSSAGVLMSYDPTTDSFSLRNKGTGGLAMTLGDTTGTLLGALNLAGGTQTLGSNATYAVNGGAIQYSTSNTVTDAVTGVTISLLSTSATPVNIMVANDTEAITQKVQGWVDQFNSAAGLIRTNTAVVPGGTSGPLAGDSLMASLLSALTTKVTSAQAGATGTYTALSQVGITFGAVGSAVGSTTTLQFDAAKFKAALESEPASVVSLFAPTGGAGFAQDMETYLEELTKSDGLMAGRISERDRQVKSLNDQITRLEDSLARQQSLLERKFQRMEEALTRLQTQQAQLAGLQNLP
jgi:flagellar hook-associated protein 2